MNPFKIESNSPFICARSIKPAPRQNRYRLLTCFALLTILSIFLAPAQELKEWQNPKLTGLSNEAPHATMIICPDTQTAQSIGLANNSERIKSAFYRSLNGDWKYHYASNHLGRIPNFWKADFNDHDWSTIPVPSNVELAGYGIPI